MDYETVVSLHGVVFVMAIVLVKVMVMAIVIVMATVMAIIVMTM